MKKYIVSAVFITLGLIMWAVDVNDFLIGAYSQYHIKNAGYDFEANFDSLRCYLANSGYNAVNYSLHTGYQSRLSSVFNKLHNNGISSIRSILTDCTWNIANSRIGVGSLAYGNRLQIEAEYQLKDSLGIFMVDGLYTDQSHECLESYNYVTKHETGSLFDGVINNQTCSNRYAWLCNALEGHLPGIALSHPRKRWKPPLPPWPAVLSKDLVFFTNAISGNRLYLTVAMRFECDTPNTPIADVSLKFYKPVGGEYSEFVMLDELTTTTYPSLRLTPYTVRLSYHKRTHHRCKTFHIETTFLNTT